MIFVGYLELKHIFINKSENADDRRMTMYFPKIIQNSISETMLCEPCTWPTLVPRHPVLKRHRRGEQKHGTVLSLIQKNLSLSSSSISQLLLKIDVKPLKMLDKQIL